MSEPGGKRQYLRRLECLRGAAAGYVFVHHYAHVVLKPSYPALAKPFKLGQFAVLVFFVVSGFVIYYSTFGRSSTPSFRAYFIRRFRRIYPPFLVVLGITWIAQCLIEGTLADPRWRELAGNVVMLQDTNVASWFAPYLQNSALWSLSYEWAFYMLFFGVLVLTREVDGDPHGPRVRLRQLSLVGAGALLGFGVHQFWPNQISLFLMYMTIWWAGVEFAREYMRSGAVTIRAQLAPLGLVALVTALWIIPVLQARAAGVELSPWAHPMLELRHFVTAIVILVGGLAWNAIDWRGFYGLLAPFERIAPISYGLYIVHKPIMHLAAERAPLGNPWLELVWVVPVVLGLSWVVERWLHRYVVRWLPG